jgi:cation diffusion facilitator CzcD-associated flavoprotein CzcO
MSIHTGNYRIIVIGAGVGGLLTMYKIRKMLPADRFELKCYEKYERDSPDQTKLVSSLTSGRNAGVGGTWHENKYPGCACDVPAHVYNPTFEQNPRWSKFYADTDEIEQYFCGFSQRHRLDKHIEFEVRFSSAVWDEGSSRCTLRSLTSAMLPLTILRSSWSPASRRYTVFRLVPLARERFGNDEQTKV